jgi:hypothetical protein
MKLKPLAKAAAMAALVIGAQQSFAEDWSDTSLAYTYGTAFKEPFVANGADITKDIYSLKHVGGDKYGTNFFNIDLLESNKVDSDAQEAYVVYRRLLDFGKIAGKDYSTSYAHGFGLTAGFDWNTKNDPGYGSKKRMLVVGPTVMFKVPGFLNVSLLALDESNEPIGISERYTYKTHADLSSAWDLHLGHGFNFQGFADLIAPKGKNEFGGATAAEQHFFGAVMYDISQPFGAQANTFKLGAGYEWWRNKFGNPYSAGDPGAFAKTPFARAEYHF